ncbi:MAG: hypothetical protein ACYTF1_05955 [Planctomycetota bacterium]
MRHCITVFMVLLGGVFAEAKATEKSLADRIGCTHVTGKYNFTDKDFLNEGADTILSTGMRVIKIWLNNPAKNYPFNSYYPDYDRLVEIAKDPHYMELFNKPFTTIIMAAYSHHGDNQHYFRKGVTDLEYALEEDEFYELTKYLLTAYRGTGKTFVLQHWEGDWAIRPEGERRPPQEPPPRAIAGMIDWLNARQAGVNRGREEVGDTDVKVYHACEVNLVEMALEGKVSVTNDVVPHTVCDLYSYSAYDTIHYARRDPVWGREKFKSALDYLASKAPDSKDFGDKNIYIGEFGCPLVRSYQDREIDREQNLRVLRMTVKEALCWGCQYIVYWQVYDNETRIYHRRPGNDEVRGFYLIGPDGMRAPVWDYFSSMLNSAGSGNVGHGQ